MNDDMQAAAERWATKFLDEWYRDALKKLCDVYWENFTGSDKDAPKHFHQGLKALRVVRAYLMKELIDGE